MASAFEFFYLEQTWITHEVPAAISRLSVAASQTTQDVHIRVSSVSSPGLTLPITLVR